MDLKLARKRVLISGGSKGIGRAAAEAFAVEQCRLVLVARSAAELEATARALAHQFSVEVDVVAADLAVSSNVTRLVSGFPDVDILINNAGAIPGGNLAEIDETTWRAAWDLKVFGYINMCRAFYPRMQARGGGVIINVVGAAAQTRDPEYICGVAGNAALTAFSQSLGSVSARHGIRVMAINPGPVATDRLVRLYRKKAEDHTGDPENWREFVKAMPFGRAATPEEIAAAIAFLASERSGYTSGSVLTIDAGLSARCG